MADAAAPQITATTRTARAGLRATRRVKPSTALTKKRAKGSMTGSPTRTPLSGLGSPSRRRASAGMTVMETNRESRTAIDRATAMSRKSWPTSSFITRMGTNTITVVRAETSTAPHTWEVPARAASVRE